MGSHSFEVVCAAKEKDPFSVAAKWSNDTNHYNRFSGILTHKF
jgi:hypothetical protein